MRARFGEKLSVVHNASKKSSASKKIQGFWQLAFYTEYFRQSPQYLWEFGLVV
jgi:hypothetical protein